METASYLLLLGKQITYNWISASFLHDLLILPVTFIHYVKLVIQNLDEVLFLFRIARQNSFYRSHSIVLV